MNRKGERGYDKTALIHKNGRNDVKYAQNKGLNFMYKAD